MREGDRIFDTGCFKDIFCNLPNLNFLVVVKRGKYTADHQVNDLEFILVIDLYKLASVLLNFVNVNLRDGHSIIFESSFG